MENQDRRAHDIVFEFFRRKYCKQKKTGSSQFRDIFSKKFKLFDKALPCHLPSLLETIPESIYPRPFLCADLSVPRPYREET